MPRTQLLVATTGDPIASMAATRGPFYRIIQETLAGVFTGDVVNVDVRTTEPLPLPDANTMVVITGSAANVPTREPWMLCFEAWLRKVVAAGVPTFGICFGHQALAHALGGECRRNPRGREIGTIVIERNGAADPIFPPDCPPTFLAHATHIDTAWSLPAGAKVLASSLGDPHHIVRFGERCYGVQFHPEFDEEIMRSYLEARTEILTTEGFDVKALLASVSTTPVAKALFERFVHLFG